MMVTTSRLLRHVERHIEDLIGILFYCYLAMIVSVEVVRRYGFNASSSWAEETSVYAFIWLAYLAASSATRDRAHLRFDILDDLLPGWARTGVSLLSDAGMAVICIIIIKTSLPTTLLQYQYSQSMLGIDLPMFLASAAVPIGWTLILIRVAQRAFRTLRPETGNT